MGILRDFYEISLDFNGGSMIFLWDFYWFPVLCFYDIFMGLLWDFYWLFMDFFSIGFLSDFYVISIVFL